jgi:aminoglycoside phosphotransferase family enzyme/predicted kinase
VTQTQSPEPATRATDANDQARLLEALTRASIYGAACKRVERLETHISCVFLTGECAYKVKKAVDFGFLDFTTLEARRKYCEEELRLNRRLAPALYLDVVPITGTVEGPVIGGTGPALEYAVKMREFSQDDLASRLLARCELSASDIDALAAKVAAFHAAVGTAAGDSSFGSPKEILRVARQNFAQLDSVPIPVADRDRLESLREWTEREFSARHGAFLRRREGRFVRECHGDLHLGNIARVDGELTIFDGIEFNESMRWIDVMSEVAFTVMDLHERGRADLAARFLNAYLETTGDYAGLPVLRFYLVYRALVRAKIARMRAAQLRVGDAQRAVAVEWRGYLALAQGYAQPPHPALVITHGFSGCGKTTLSQALLETIGAVRMRSDVERKRFQGRGALERDRAGVDQDLYTAGVTEQTYRHLAELTREVVGAGFVAIVDAAFLKRWQRDLFRDLARQLGTRLVILDLTANEATLRQRIERRAATGSDASDADLAVLTHQLRTNDPLGQDELSDTVTYDADAPVEAAREAGAWTALLSQRSIALSVR